MSTSFALCDVIHVWSVDPVIIFCCNFTTKCHKDLAMRRGFRLCDIFVLHYTELIEIPYHQNNWSEPSWHKPCYAINCCTFHYCTFLLFVWFEALGTTGTCFGTNMYIIFSSSNVLSEMLYCCSFDPSNFCLKQSGREILYRNHSYGTTMNICCCFYKKNSHF